MYRHIADIVYLLDVLVVVVHISHSNCWITYYCTRIEVSVLRAGRGVGVWGGGWKFLVTEFVFFAKKCPGVLKLRTGGGFWGVWGALRPHPGVARSRKTIHFFL